MKIIFDQLKDTVNIDKHGISLADAKLLEWDTLWTMPDTRHHYGENRQIGYAYIGLKTVSRRVVSR